MTSRPAALSQVKYLDSIQHIAYPEDVFNLLRVLPQPSSIPEANNVNWLAYSVHSPQPPYPKPYREADKMDFTFWISVDSFLDDITHVGLGNAMTFEKTLTENERMPLLQCAGSYKFAH
ncbi:hypothetical protein AG1IA_02531 [Rhizoctonia solani AG-1 IA]|uniref:Uncharacterized protein n=1 Tax=Thanatephorus cucumeris (strain AG1-IA) TaxID=983506 RepID=L8X494_THACA|nr:hypothetical protein AG1IA_02531 [Rhizoctonia solani AG-1 IA]